MSAFNGAGGPLPSIMLAGPGVAVQLGACCGTATTTYLPDVPSNSVLVWFCVCGVFFCLFIGQVLVCLVLFSLPFFIQEHFRFSLGNASRSCLCGVVDSVARLAGVSCWLFVSRLSNRDRTPVEILRI